MRTLDGDAIYCWNTGMFERVTLSVMTALVAAAWVFYLTEWLGAASWRWLALPLAILLGALTWFRYSGGHRTEAVFAVEVPPIHRRLIALVMTIVGFVGGFITLPTFGVHDVPISLELALGLSLATLWGWIAWNHPALFYKNRRF